MKPYSPFLFVTLAAMLAVGTTSAQEPQPASDAKPAAKRAPDPPLVPLDIQIVVSRYHGEKKVSSLPFSLSVNANDPIVSQLRMDANVPVPQTMLSARDSGVAPVTSWNYKDVGTAVDCHAKMLEDGRFQVMLSVEDSSVYANAQDPTTPTVREAPIIRSFKSKNTLLLRDGQSRQFTAAADRVNGEVIKIDVTLRVVK